MIHPSAEPCERGSAGGFFALKGRGALFCAGGEGTAFDGALFRADAKKRYSALWDSELCAGERVQPAGYRPARAFARAGSGGGTMRFYCGVLCSVYACRCISIGALCVRFTPAVAFLLERFVFGLRLPLHFYWSALCLITPAVCRVRAKQEGLRNASFLFRVGRDRHSCILGCCAVIGL